MKTIAKQFNSLHLEPFFALMVPYPGTLTVEREKCVCNLEIRSTLAVSVFDECG